MGYEIDATNDEFLDDGGSESGRLELNDEPSETDHAAPPLQRLPPDPYRSLGGFLNYAGWPDCERMMELDGAIQSQCAGRPGRAQPRAAHPAAPLPIARGAEQAFGSALQFTVARSAGRDKGALPLRWRISWTTPK
jgi:hypothetical protein